MKPEVSIKVLAASWAGARAQGFDLTELGEGLGLPGPDDPAPPRFVAWDPLTRLVDRIAERLGGIAAYEQWAWESVARTPQMRILGVAGMPVRALYVVGFEWLLRALYPCCSSRVDLLPGGMIALESGIPAELRGCLPIFASSLAAAKWYPRLLGLQEAVVEGELSTHGYRFRVIPPQDRSIAARAIACAHDLFLSVSESVSEPVPPALVTTALTLSLELDEQRLSGEAAGQALALVSTEAELGRALGTLLRERCCARYLALWAQRPEVAGLRLVCQDGSPPDRIRSRPLVVGSRAVGRMDVDLTAIETPGLSPFLEAILPWVALALHRCTETSETTSLPRLPGRGAEAAALAEAASRRLGLTPRERDVVERLLLGETRKEIGRTLAISPRTVDVYVGRLLEKAGMGSTKALIVKLWSEPLSETD